MLNDRERQRAETFDVKHLRRLLGIPWREREIGIDEKSLETEEVCWNDGPEYFEMVWARGKDE